MCGGGGWRMVAGGKQAGKGMQGMRIGRGGDGLLRDDTGAGEVSGTQPFDGAGHYVFVHVSTSSGGRACDVERDGQALADAKWDRAVPHGGREQDEPAWPRLDGTIGRQVYPEFGLGAAERELAGLVLLPGRAHG